MNANITVRCERPPNIILSSTGLAVLSITNHDTMSPALVGSKTSITVSCSTEIGESNETATIICMEDAKWYLQHHNHTKCEGTTHSHSLPEYSFQPHTASHVTILAFLIKFNHVRAS